MNFIKKKDFQLNLLNNCDTLEKMLVNWLELFIDCYFEQHITPYMHAFVYHVPEFMRVYKNLDLFNLQGLEKLNDISTLIYHRSTNKKNNKNFLKQMFEKQNRMELFIL